MILHLFHVLFLALLFACNDAVITVPGGLSEPIPVPAKIGFINTSFSALAGRPLLIQPQVALQTSDGTTIPLASDTITLEAFFDANCTQPVSGVFTANSTVTVNGVATFSGVSYSKTGSIYIKASSVNGYGSDCSHVTRVMDRRLSISNSGRGSACAVVNGGQIRCWGHNSNGELGNGTSINAGTSVLVSGITNAIAVDMGGTYDGGGGTTCALLADNTAKCWGRNFGNVPVDFPIPSNTVKLSLGGGHYCALIADGRINCWGYNSFGQLGDGTNVTRGLNSTTATGITNALDVQGTWYGTWASLADGTYSGWGNMGSGNTPTSYDRFNGLSDTVALGGNICAVMKDQTVKCWGWSTDDNLFGQLGNGSFVDVNNLAQTAVGVVGAVAVVATGEESFCAQMDDGTVKCWGKNSVGQIGDGTQINRNIPTTVPGVANVEALHASGGTVCALITGDTIKCWGSNSHNQLGINANIIRTTPVTVSGLTNISQVATGNAHACALNTVTNTVSCWGNNSYGQLGDGSYAHRSTPVQVIGLVGTIAQISAGTSMSCALNTLGDVQCWGYGGHGRLGNGGWRHYGNNQASGNVAISGAASSIFSSIFYRSCVLIGGELECWAGSDQTLGTGLSGSSYGIPTASASGVSNIIQFDLGDGGGCAVSVGGALNCWGDSKLLGNGATVSTSTPTTPDPFTPNVGAVDVAVFNETYHTGACVVLDGGSVNCWGNNGYGQLGLGHNNQFLTPQAVPGITTASQITGGRRHVCALLSGGTANCWGYNINGELGNNSTTNSYSPVVVSGLTNANQIAAGVSYTCAVLTDGTVRCWGDNSSGQLGNGDISFSASAGDVL